MGTFSVWHWLIVLVVVLVLFGGGGKIPKLMRDMGQGVNAFKKGLKEGDEAKDGEGETKAIDQEAAAVASSSSDDDDTKKAASG